MNYKQLFMHYIVYIKFHTNFHSDAFRHQMTPSAVSSVYCIFDTTECRLHISDTGIKALIIHLVQAGDFKITDALFCTVF
jgi:hypothetical protein